MAVIGAWAASMFSSQVGTIGTTATFTKPQDFDPPQNILALPLLRYITESDDETVTRAYISEFIDGGTKNTGEFMGVAAQSCSKIKWSLYCDHSFNNPTRLILFFGAGKSAIANFELGEVAMADRENTAEVERATAVALYDPANGSIVHMHYSVVDSGAELPGRDDLEREALEHFTRHASTRAAKRKSFNMEKISFLHVDPETFRMDRSYKVDTKKRVLVEMRKRKS